MNNSFKLGKIVAHHGVRGELKIYPYTENLGIFSKTGYFIADNVRYEVKSSKSNKNMILVKLAGYDTIESSLFLIGKEIFVDRVDIPDDGQGHFVADLIGLDVFDKDTHIGVLLDVLSYPHQDLYEIKLFSGKKVLIPVVDEFVKDISLKDRRITLSLIEGMLDL